MQNRGLHLEDRKTCCMICDLRVGLIIIAIVELIECGQQSLMAFAVSLAYKPLKSPYSPNATVKLLNVYSVIQAVSFFAAIFGLIATITQGRRFKISFKVWTGCLCVLSLYQLACLFYVIIEFNSKIVSTVGLAFIIFFVPKNFYFCMVMYRYQRSLSLGIYDAEYTELDADNYIRRSRSGSRKESVRTSKENLPYPSDYMDQVVSGLEIATRKTTTTPFSFLRVIPEASESKENSTEDSYPIK